MASKKFTNPRLSLCNKHSHIQILHTLKSFLCEQNIKNCYSLVFRKTKTWLSCVGFKCSSVGFSPHSSNISTIGYVIFIMIFLRKNKKTKKILVASTRSVRIMPPTSILRNDSNVDYLDRDEKEKIRLYRLAFFVMLEFKLLDLLVSH